MLGGTPTRAVLPALAAACACTYLASLVWPGLLLVLAVVAPAAACSLVLLRRRSPGLVATLAAVALWLALGITGAMLLRSHPTKGLVWLLVVLFLLPLPAIPWLYSRTFSAPDDTGQPSRSPIPGPRSPLPPDGGSS